MITADKIYILLNPGHSEAKRAQYAERLKRIPLADGAGIEFVELMENGDPENILSQNGLQARHAATALTPREAARMAGHWQVWQKAIAVGTGNVIILEEGFLPESNHYHIVPSDHWDLLYLGRDTDGGDFPSQQSGMVFPGYSDGAFAYMVTAPALAKLLAAGYQQNAIPVGDFLSAMHGAHPEEDVRTLFSERLVALAPMKSFITKDTFHPWASGYEPLHRELYTLTTPEGVSIIKQYIHAQILQREYDLICDEPIDNVFTFPLFTPLFCQHLVEEAEHFGQWTSYRGEHRPATDIKLSSLGLQETYSALLQKYLYPIFYHKYQLQGDGWKKMTSQNFIVRYRADEQGHLGLHNDGSYLSMVVALNTDYDDGGTYFPKFKKLIRHERAGYASIHPGLIGYVHGARPITRGRRYILASFFFSANHHPLMEDLY